MVPRQGEQCPVENNSFKGYSLPKCTCNVISHIQVKPYTFLLKCLHAMDENVTHPVTCPESSLTPSHMHMPSVKTVIYVPSMTIFPKQKLLFYKSKFIGQTPIFPCFYQVLCVFVGSEFSRFLRRLRTPSNTFTNFHRWIHMYNQKYQIFHPKGYLSLLAIPDTHIFHFLFLLCDREAHFRRCPILPSPPSNTKHSVDLYHALTPMSCDVPRINAMQCHYMCLMLHAQ